MRGWQDDLKDTMTMSQPFNEHKVEYLMKQIGLTKNVEWSFVRSNAGLVAYFTARNLYIYFSHRHPKPPTPAPSIRTVYHNRNGMDDFVEIPDLYKTFKVPLVLFNQKSYDDIYNNFGAMGNNQRLVVYDNSSSHLKYRICILRITYNGNIR
jgi:hypothetical protein